METRRAGGRRAWMLLLLLEAAITEPDVEEGSSSCCCRIAASRDSGAVFVRDCVRLNALGICFDRSFLLLSSPREISFTLQRGLRPLLGGQLLPCHRLLCLIGSDACQACRAAVPKQTNVQPQQQNMTRPRRGRKDAA